MDIHKETDSRKLLLEKIFNLQNSIGTISKDETNPFFHSKYFDINSLLRQLKPELEKQRLLILQPLITHMSRVELQTRIYDVDTGDFISEEVILPEVVDAQKFGSVVTYYRRYALQSMLSLEAADDDDGNIAASRPQVSPVPKAKIELRTLTGEISAPQQKLIHTLLGQKGKKLEDFGLKSTTKLDKNRASALINKLMSMPSQGETITESEDLAEVPF